MIGIHIYDNLIWFDFPYGYESQEQLVSRLEKEALKQVSPQMRMLHANRVIEEKALLELERLTRSAREAGISAQRLVSRLESMREYYILYEKVAYENTEVGPMYLNRKCVTGPFIKSKAEDVLLDLLKRDDVIEGELITPEERRRLKKNDHD